MATNSRVNEPPQGLIAKLRATLRMIKFAHTIFAMPFALIGWAMGSALVSEAGYANPELSHLAAKALPIPAQQLGFEHAPWAWTLIWVIVAMFGARSFAMTVNRIVDRHIDADNPRTAAREIPAGVLSQRFAWGFALISALIFLVASAMLNHQTLILAPVALFVVGLYSYTKRWTALCHVVLGVGLALAPIGGWLAATGRPMEIVSGTEFVPFGTSLFGALPNVVMTDDSTVLAIAFHIIPLLLGAGVLLWVAGFDIIYSLQDREFDGQRGLKSLPVKLGAQGALNLSRAFHFCAAFAWLGALALFNGDVTTLSTHFTGLSYAEYSPVHQLGFFAYLGLGLVVLCLLYEHSLVKHDDLSRVGAAFFTVNGVISVLFATLVIADLLIEFDHAQG